eukprot:COSAG02_NODE_16524_length_1077_cov_0.822086_1_plen_341_part_10
MSIWDTSPKINTYPAAGALIARVRVPSVVRAPIRNLAPLFSIASTPYVVFSELALVTVRELYRLRRPSSVFTYTSTGSLVFRLPGMSSTPTAFEPPETRWDDLQAKIHSVNLPPGLVTVRWPDASLEQAVAALDRDGAFIVENAASVEACDAVQDQMRPYVEASAETTDGSKTRRPGAVIGRSRASWALATHPFLRQVCEGVLGRQVLTRSSDEVAAELFADRGFKQHPYYLDISMLIAVGPGGLAQGLHLDAGKHIMDFRPFGIETTISTMWALSDFSADGGATSVCLGSRHWGRWRRPSRDEAVPATMSKGSCLVFSGNTWHGSGENASPNIRWGLNID